MWLWEQFSPTIWWLCGWDEPLKEGNQSATPHGEAAGKGPSGLLGGTFSTMAKLGWPVVTRLEARLHQSIGAGLGPVWGSHREEPGSLQCHGAWGERAWLHQPHTSAPAPSGLLFKAHVWETGQCGLNKCFGMALE